MTEVCHSDVFDFFFSCSIIIKVTVFHVLHQIKCSYFNFQQLMPNIERLDLSHNRIESIQNLHWLSQLTHIDLSHNNIHHADSLHTKLGNVKCVRLAYNHLESLHGKLEVHFSLPCRHVCYIFRKLTPLHLISTAWPLLLAKALLTQVAQLRLHEWGIEHGTSRSDCRREWTWHVANQCVTWTITIHTLWHLLRETECLWACPVPQCWLLITTTVSGLSN